jgi:uncharacterized protein YegP (UPF0339 family)
VVWWSGGLVVSKQIIFFANIIVKNICEIYLPPITHPYFTSIIGYPKFEIFTGKDNQFYIRFFSSMANNGQPYFVLKAKNGSILGKLFCVG